MKLNTGISIITRTAPIYDEGSYLIRSIIAQGEIIKDTVKGLTREQIITFKINSIKGKHTFPVCINKIG